MDKKNIYKQVGNTNKAQPNTSKNKQVFKNNITIQN